jgi:hypothetical protein
MNKYMRQPFPAAVAAALTVYFYLMLKTKLNGEETKPNSYYIKPAFLVAALVYIIVHIGQNEGEPLKDSGF